MTERISLEGSVWKVGNDVDTDLIIAARYLNQSEPAYLALHCMEDLFPELPEKIKSGDILVAGKNFGCGSSREHAPIAIKAAGFSCVIADSFARIFYRNAINIGLPIMVVPGLVEKIEKGTLLKVDISSGRIEEAATGKVFQGEPFPSFMLEILAAGGLVPYSQKKVKNGI